jgi:hypothetical protein
MANNIKVRVGQTPAVKVLTSGTISAVPSFSALTDTSFSNLTDGQFAAYEASSGLWKNTSTAQFDIDGGVY